MKFFQTTFILITAFSFSVKGQTNVSGGIYANSTWTKANSPYIVTDNIVLFPGYTLTIEPGVIVKFIDEKNIEIRNATLIAIGTSVDSITFTSNSLTPVSGIWGSRANGGIFLNGASSATSFNFCHIQFATYAINNAGGFNGIKNSVILNNYCGLQNVGGIQIDSCIIKYNSYGIKHTMNCSFNFCDISNNFWGIDLVVNCFISNCVIDSNQVGMGADEGVEQSTIYNCSFNYNDVGMISDGAFEGNTNVENCTFYYNSGIGLKVTGFGYPDTVINCVFKFNEVGLVASACDFAPISGIVANNIVENNNIGIQVGGCMDIYCNKFCNNTSYDLENLEVSPHNVANNYWCLNDSLTIRSHIKDGYVDPSLGLITFMPIDTFQCYLINGIPINETGTSSFVIYPNPVSDYLTIDLPENIYKTDIEILNMTGQLIYSATIEKQNNKIDISILKQGVYIFQLANKEEISRKKFIKQ